MRIRELTLDDVDAADALWRRTPGVGPVGRDELERLLAATPELVLAAVDEGALIGTVLGSDDGRRGWIFRLAVDEAHRGQGVGRALVTEVERRLRARGVRHLRLLVLDDNELGRAFWPRAGYETYGQVWLFGKDLEADRDPAGAADAGGC